MDDKNIEVLLLKAFPILKKGNMDDIYQLMDYGNKANASQFRAAQFGQFCAYLFALHGSNASRFNDIVKPDDFHFLQSLINRGFLDCLIYEGQGE
jgi:hypothetical protein